jgi:hypothetical protein
MFRDSIDCATRLGQHILLVEQVRSDSTGFRRTGMSSASQFAVEHMSNCPRAIQAAVEPSRPGASQTTLVQTRPDLGTAQAAVEQTLCSGRTHYCRTNRSRRSTGCSRTYTSRGVTDNSSTVQTRPDLGTAQAAAEQICAGAEQIAVEQTGPGATQAAVEPTRPRASQTTLVQTRQDLGAAQAAVEQICAGAEQIAVEQTGPGKAQSAVKQSRPGAAQANIFEQTRPREDRTDTRAFVLHLNVSVPVLHFEGGWDACFLFFQFFRFVSKWFCLFGCFETGPKQ